MQLGHVAVYSYARDDIKEKATTVFVDRRERREKKIQVLKVEKNQSQGNFLDKGKSPS